LSAVTPAVVGQAEDAAGVRKATEQFYSAYNAHDAKAVAALVDEMCENWGGTLRGRAAYEENYRRRFERSRNIRERMVAEIGVVFLTPDIAIHKFRDEVSGAVDGDGNAVPPAERLRAVVYMSKEGEWLRVAQFTRTIEELEE
jgi:ketosteroid isomerase-like protein